MLTQRELTLYDVERELHDMHFKFGLCQECYALICGNVVGES